MHPDPLVVQQKQQLVGVATPCGVYLQSERYKVFIAVSAIAPVSIHFIRI